MLSVDGVGRPNVQDEMKEVSYNVKSDCPLYSAPADRCLDVPPDTFFAT